jgi:Domain of unknown function (DUF4386)
MTSTTPATPSATTPATPSAIASATRSATHTAAALTLPSEPASSRICAGTLLIVEGLLSFAPVAVLGAAIGWPASLGKPAGEQLAAIAAQPAAVSAGYAVYLLYSILVAPLMISLAARTFGDLRRPLAATVAAFGALSALARSIGILRWLTVMPMLAAAHAKAPPAERLQIELLFTGLTTYGGGIGEILGVSLFMSASLGLLTVGALLRRSMPAWLAAWGLVSAAMLGALALPALRGPLLVPVAVAVSVLSAWMLAAGVWTLRKPR